jgi:beta-mannosidase
MELSEGWRAVAADDDLRRSYQAGDYDDETWEPITVPGHWRSVPAFAGSDGPILARCRFDAPAPARGRRAWLTFDGLFYQGDVWLDGSYLGDTEGYFFPHAFEVTDALRGRSGHTLAVEVTCAPERNPGAKRNLTGAFQAGHYAAPDGNPGGIWRPVRVTETGPVRIARLVVLCRRATAEEAVVGFRATLDSDDARTVRLRTELGGADHEVDTPLAAGANTVEWEVTVARPTLWWPRALGEAHLLDLRVAALTVEAQARPGDNGASGAPATGPAGTVSDERRLRTGLRTVRLRRWVCSVNGERLFLKGADLGPARLALGEASPDEVRADVGHAVAAGLDLVRLHGHVGRPETYDAADEAGLLLWQDMPLRGPYARAVRRQAARQAGELVALLGHHPSVAVWCGHDEPAPLPGGPPDSAGRGVRRELGGQQLPTWNRAVLDASVKRALERADGTRPVVAHSGVLPHPPLLDGTDTHLYAGWHWGDERQLAGLARALPRLVRFVSEFGAQAVPAGEGAAFCEPDRWPDLDWGHLATAFGLERQRFERYVPPADYPTFAAWQEATQRYQAELIRRQVEALRRLKYRPTGGFALAVLADARPAVSLAVLDHQRRPKAGYAALREACQPVVVVADRLPAVVAPSQALALDVHVVSDLRESIVGAQVTARVAWTGGQHAWRFAGDVPADACVRVGTMQLMTPDESGPLTLDLRLRLPAGEVVVNRYEAAVSARGAGGGGHAGVP